MWSIGQGKKVRGRKNLLTASEPSTALVFSVSLPKFCLQHLTFHTSPDNLQWNYDQKNQKQDRPLVKKAEASDQDAAEDVNRTAYARIQTVRDKYGGLRGYGERRTKLNPRQRPKDEPNEHHAHAYDAHRSPGIVSELPK
jgi:hypothetical protein